MDKTLSNLRAMTLLSAGLAAVTAMLVLSGWATRTWTLTSFGQSYAPMALGSALGYALFSSAILIRCLRPTSRYAHFYGRVVAGLLSLVCLLVLLQFFANIDLGFEQYLMPLPATPLEYRDFRISPVTAAVLILAAHAHLLTLPARPSRLARQVGGLLALLVTALGLLSMLGYSYGAPFLYTNDPLLPQSLPSAIASFFLGSALLARSGPQTWIMQPFAGESMRAQLLRVFVPTILTALILSTWTNYLLIGTLHANPALTAAGISMIFLLCIAGLVGILAGKIGERIDQLVTELKESQKSLQLFKAIIEESQEAVTITDRNGRLVYINPAHVRLFGYSPEEALARSDSDNYSPEARQKVENEIAPLLALGGSWEGELDACDARGRRFPLWTRAGAICDARGALLYRFNFMHDASKNRALQEKLSESERLFRLIVENIRDTVWLMDMKLNITWINPSVEQTRGFTLPELGTMTLDQHLTPRSWEKIRAAIQELLTPENLADPQVEIHFSSELEYTCKGGGVFWGDTTIQMLRDANGAPRGFLCVGRDINERKKAEELLVNSEKRLRALIEKSSDALALVDTSGRLVYLSPAYERITHYSNAERHNRNPFDLIHPDDQAMAREMYAEVLAAPGNSRAFSVRSFTKDHQYRWLEVVATNLMHEATVQAIVINAHDITARRQAELALQRQLQRMQVLRAIDTAIASGMTLAHTFNMVLEQALFHLEMEAASILLLKPDKDPHKRTLVFASGQGFLSAGINDVALPFAQGLAWQAVRQRQRLVIPDIHLYDDDELGVMISQEHFRFYCGAPLIVKGEVKGVLEIFSRSSFTPDGEWLDFLENLANQTAIAIDNAALVEGLQRSHAELSEAYEATIEGWAQALELRDKETRGHSDRVTALTLELAQKMGLSAEELIHLRRGVFLHDIGKMVIPDNILLKPGPLSPDEWVIMRQHPQYAHQMLAGIPYLRPALDVPYCHHEKWDGSGYPRGLKGEEIPLAARIFAVVDVWDALTTDRPYRPGWTADAARACIREQAGKHFDPQVAQAFLEILDQHRDAQS